MYGDEKYKLEVIDSNGTNWIAKFISKDRLSNFIDKVTWDRSPDKSSSKRIMVSDDDGIYFNPSHIFRMKRVYSEED